MDLQTVGEDFAAIKYKGTDNYMIWYGSYQPFELSASWSLSVTSTYTTGTEIRANL